MKAQPLITITKTQPVAQLYFELGKAWYLKDNYKDAVDCLQKALDNNSDGAESNSDILLMMAAAQIANDQPQLATQSYLLAIVHAPDIALKVLEQVVNIDNRFLAEETVNWIENNWYPYITKLNLTPDQQGGIDQFLGDILLSKNKELNAGKHYSKASDLFHNEGKNLYWEGKYEDACRYFAKAAAVRKDFVLNYWYWSDALLLRSYIPEKPFNDPKLLNEADKVWETGRSYNKPGKDDSWAYVVKARILNQQSALHRNANGYENFDLLREAWVVLEDALLLKSNDRNILRDLANISRLLGFNYASLATANKAIEISPDYQLAQEEVAANLLDLGNSQKARELLNSFIANPKYNFPLYSAWLALSYYNEQRYDEAITLLSDYLKNSPDDDWSLSVIMNCYWKTGNFKEAGEIAKKILVLSERGVKITSLTEGICRYTLGETDAAIQIAERSLKDPDQHLSAVIDLQLYYLHKGDTDASKKYLDEILSLALRPFQVKEVLGNNETILAIAKKENLNYYGQLNKAIKDDPNGFAIRIKKRLEELEKDTTLRYKELQSALETHPGYSREGTAGWIAATASVAQWFIENSDPVSAVACYEKLKKYEQKIPDAFLGFVKIMESSFVKAVREQNPALIKKASDSLRDKPEIWHHLDTTTIEEFTNAIFKEQDSVEFFWKAIETIDYFKLNDDREYNVVKVLAGSVRENLLQKLADRYKVSYITNLYHVVTPVAIEMANDLIPATQEEYDNWSFIKVDLENLRNEIKAERGVQLPVPRVRVNEYLMGFQYQFLLQEIPIILYSGVSQKKEGILREVIINLKDFLIKNLSLFIDLDSLYLLIQDWKKEDERSATQLNTLFPDMDPVKLSRFLRVLRRLLRESVPITDWRRIIFTLNKTGLLHNDVHPDICEVRLAIKPSLPGNQLNKKRVQLSGDLEQWIVDGMVTKYNKYYFTAMPEETQKWLSNFRNFVNKYEKDIVIFIKDKNARPFLKRVVELEFPDMVVMTKEESMTKEEIKKWNAGQVSSASKQPLTQVSA